MAFETEDRVKRLPVWKIILFSLTPLLALLIVIEVAMSVVYYQRFGNQPLAMIGAYNAAIEWIVDRPANKLRQIAREKVDALELPPGLYEAFFSDKGRPVREHFMQRYEGYFSQLVKEVNEVDSKLVVFFPVGIERDRNTELHHVFFSNMAKKYSIDFLDMSGSFHRRSIEATSLLPFDPHFSRFGNYLIASRLREYLATMEDRRPGKPPQSETMVFGDLDPGMDQVWEPKHGAPYRVKANRSGLRMDYDIPVDTAKQKILVLGDSASFGPYLPGHDTFPAILDRMVPQAIVMNAGIPGYTIADELSLFSEKAKYVNPDIVVLQVLGNDLFDLFFFKRKFFDRKGRISPPSPLEAEFIEAVRADAS